jgi:hypothetical protein
MSFTEGPHYELALKGLPGAKVVGWHERNDKGEERFTVFLIVGTSAKRICLFDVACASEVQEVLTKVSEIFDLMKANEAEGD